MKSFKDIYDILIDLELMNNIHVGLGVKVVNSNDSSKCFIGPCRNSE